MAGWIKMRNDLWIHPKILALESALGVSRTTIIGALFGVWRIADAHANSKGMLEFFTTEMIDNEIGLPNFANSLIDVEWLLQKPKGLQFPKYQQHNGTTGKSRAEAQKRKAVSRKSVTGVTEKCDTGHTKMIPEERRGEEIRGEENNNTDSLHSPRSSGHLNREAHRVLSFYPEKRVGPRNAASKACADVLLDRVQANPSTADSPDAAYEAERWLADLTKAFAKATELKDRQFIPLAAKWYTEGGYLQDPAEWSVGCQQSKHEQGMAKISKIIEEMPDE